MLPRGIRQKDAPGVSLDKLAMWAALFIGTGLDMGITPEQMTKVTRRASARSLLTAELAVWRTNMEWSEVVKILALVSPVAILAGWLLWLASRS